MLVTSLLSVCIVVCLAVTTLCQEFPSGASHSPPKTPVEGDGLQDLVMWDQHSLIVRGERIMIFSGEFHPFRLPVPGLWLDVFQKIKSMGFTGVSFYVDWGLVEANPGHVVTDGIWSLENFFNAATQAGVYLIARPGPYINAETVAGGIPGWVLRTPGQIRYYDTDYLNTTTNYMATIGQIIEKAQITNGGPVIIVQAENEYDSWSGITDFPNEMNRQYMAYVESQLREAGITVPLSTNHVGAPGYWAPGTGLGAADIYAIDAYPLRFDCANPTVWPTSDFPYDWQVVHQEQSPTTPFVIGEFQGGSDPGWGGVVEEMCAELFNEEAVRVLYKNNYSFGVKYFNIYMTYGGTNWGNLGYMNGYTSYDYGAAITEERSIWREKFSEQKLQANFLKVSSPAYLTATSGLGVNGSYGTPSTIAVTPLFGNGTNTNFYIIRHSDFTSLSNTLYNMTVSTSVGNITIPQLGGSLALNGRDSKIHVTDYDVGGVNIIYSSAEIFAWAQKAGSRRVLILYGGAEELHELALEANIGEPYIIEGNDITICKRGATWVIQWQVTPGRRIIRASNLEIYLLWRNDAYNYWALELPAQQPIGNFSSPSKDLVIVKAGYLIRHADIVDGQLRLYGDVNATTEIEIISTPKHVHDISFNGEQVQTWKSETGKLSATIQYQAPSVDIPELSDLEWKYLDSLPEIQLYYNDSGWTSCTKNWTNNPRNLTTPQNLYSLDYGYHTGSLIYRGHFVSNGQESSLWVNVSGGTGFGHSIWLNNTFLGSWAGSSTNSTIAQNLSIPHTLSSGRPYILTILIDVMGQVEAPPGSDELKFPFGILDYGLSGHPQSDIAWKVTGNLGGEQYQDLARGPLNEGAFYAERQGYHYPKPPDATWLVSNPVKDGISQPGVGFFTTSFNLDIPDGWDIPMSIVFNGSARGVVEANSSGVNYRCEFFVNGYQFGKYINNLGPQTYYPVPQGILNYNGTNYIAITLWALDPQGANIGGLDLVPTSVIRSGFSKPQLAPQPSWELRQGAY